MIRFLLLQTRPVASFSIGVAVAEADHSLGFDAPSGDDEPILKASARKSSRFTKLKTNSKAVNGAKLKGSKETQAEAITSEKKEEKVDLKIVKKWGVFSPLSFRGASMMRVGAHGTNEHTHFRYRVYHVALTGCC